MTTSDHTADTVAVGQLVLRERQCRDRNWWDDMRSCYAGDSAVRLSWFRGNGPDFVTASEDMAARGDKGVHRMHPPIVEIDGDRALVELGAGIETRTVLDDVELDLVSYARLIYRARRYDGRWLITALDPVYERDTLTPAVPGTPLRIEPEVLASFRPSYRMLSYVLDRRGYTVGGDLFGDDRPDEVRALEREGKTWLHTDRSSATR
ncbi:SnoaL-like domain-containing protein [Nocardia nova SH22a]|uniref:SnoaL-like domain-containing protein n=1 Tax=Nocardia nova SH22a TaxID=1415166 RepID=W5THU6_9NOCA|nr:nuclear transport factor 2 family protein [Nocardia nova]AHH18563.1 SnoaL-like domain-containing protein [Nocardia nova SH22a]